MAAACVGHGSGEVSSIGRVGLFAPVLERREDSEAGYGVWIGLAQSFAEREVDDAALPKVEDYSDKSQEGMVREVMHMPQFNNESRRLVLIN